MYSSQLLRVLQASATHVNNEICSFDTDEPKATMKESPGRYTNPFLSDEENDEVNLWNNPELGRSIVEDDFTTNPEDEEFIKSLASRNVPSEFFETTNQFYTDKNVMGCELPELTACYRENGFHVVKDICVDEGLSHGEKILIDKDHCEVFCNSVPVNGDKHDDMVEGSLNTQFLKHEWLKLSSVRDCCMNGDSCFGTKEKIDIDSPIPDPFCDHRNVGKCSDTEFFPIQDGQSSPRGKNCEEDAMKEVGTKAKIASDLVIPNELTNVSKNDREEDDGPFKCAPDELKLFVESIGIKNTENGGPGDSMQTGEQKLDLGANLQDEATTEQIVSNSMLSLEEDHPLTSILCESSNDGVTDVDQQPYQSPVEEISKNPFIGSETEELGRIGQTTNISNQNKVEESITLNFDTGKSSTSSDPCGANDPECVHELSLETQTVPNHRDMASNVVTMANQLQHGEGESSFSVVDPVSSVITYSGPIAFSGSISLRSDSSTTSVRSFAFPILQTEWNSSPVRMAKAERRRLQKHRGWRQALLCCRF